MKDAFEFNLKGKEWFSLWAMFLVPTLLLQGLSFLVKAPSDAGFSLGYLGLTLAILYLQVLVSSWFQIPILSLQLSRLSVGGKTLAFKGDSLEYVKINAVGFLLSIVTVGIYLPWYTRQVTSYLASKTEFDGEPADFLGKAGQLLVIFLVGFVVVVVLAVVLLVPFVLAFSGNGASIDQTTGAVTIGTLAVVLLLSAPWIYAIYRWMVQYRWKSSVVRWDTKFWRSSGFLLGQTALTLVTLGIYAPAALLRAYRYFLVRTVVEQDNSVRVRFSFEANLLQGFGLLWVQGLLTVITLGFYWPWALEKLGPWFASATKAEVLADPIRVQVPVTRS